MNAWFWVLSIVLSSAMSVLLTYSNHLHRQIERKQSELLARKNAEIFALCRILKSSGVDVEMNWLASSGGLDGRLEVRAIETMRSGGKPH